jgi:hypothetical protein
MGRFVCYLDQKIQADNYKSDCCAKNKLQELYAHIQETREHVHRNQSLFLRSRFLARHLKLYPETRALLEIYGPPAPAAQPLMVLPD